MTDFKKSAWADNRFAESYLDKAEVYVVERRKMLWFVTSLVSHFYGREGGINVLDLGCGDGIVTHELLTVNGNIAATLVDGGDAMLRKAKERLGAYRNMKFVKASFQEILEGKAALGNYDVCVSSMAIHHLDLSEKSALFRLIHAHLNPGGRFVNIDVTLAPSEELQTWYVEIWKDWMAHMMDRHHITDEAPEDVIRRYQDPVSMNKPDTLQEQLNELETAGFKDVDCYYKNGLFAVFGGKR
jgi:tRNA (cmo5U34)-methyltransferase